jgi:hypothetical protein
VHGLNLESLGSPEELARFAELQESLPAVVEASRQRRGIHTSVVVPSISVNQEELAKVEGSSFYEERLLFTLIRLANPQARMVYVTSQPVHREILEYYLQHLPGIPLSRARERLLFLCLYDASPKPLTQKILERPRVVERLRRWIGPHQRAYLTSYNSTALERRLAVELGIPLNSVDPSLLWMGTKSGSRKIFEEAGVGLPEGTNDVRTRDGIVAALESLRRLRPDIRRAVVKLNESFAGEGNAVYVFPGHVPEGGAGREALDGALADMRWGSPQETLDGFLRKMGEMGGVVEEWVEGEEVHSPSVQMRVHAGGDLHLVSTHDQVLGGATGQAYLGCRFPARDDYRVEITEQGLRIGEVLARNGAIGRFGVDFVVARSGGGAWDVRAVEINLRMGGTTPPFMALEFLGRGGLDPATGLYTAADGREKFYFATDNLKSPAYRGLLPDDLLDLMVEHGLHFQHLTLSGVLFFMIGALSQYGKLGVTSIGNSREEAEELYRRTVAILDRATGAITSEVPGVPHSLFEHDAPGME